MSLFEGNTVSESCYQIIGTFGGELINTDRNFLAFNLLLIKKMVAKATEEELDTLRQLVGEFGDQGWEKTW